MLLTKAFRFDVKADESKTGEFAGRASVYGVVDSYGDVVMPGAFTASLAELGGRIKVLNQHNPMDAIGIATLSDTDTALVAEGSLVLDLQSAKDAHTRLKHGLIDGISIGYEVKKDGYDKGVRQLHEIKLWEISLVTFPANQFARVTDVKSALERYADLPLVQNVLSVLPDVKAGRVLSASNRSKIADVVALLQELLDASDPDKDAKAAEIAAIETLTAHLRSLKAA